MNKSAAFTIYNASAGSGKTFTLVKEYLKRILTSNQEDAYKNLLAITFTNKAVKEMKERIIDNLISFSSEGFDHSSSEMFQQITDEIGYSTKQIKTRSQLIVRHLLHQRFGPRDRVLSRALPHRTRRRRNGLAPTVVPARSTLRRTHDVAARLRRTRDAGMRRDLNVLEHGHRFGDRPHGGGNRSRGHRKVARIRRRDRIGQRAVPAIVRPALLPPSPLRNAGPARSAAIPFEAPRAARP